MPKDDDETANLRNELKLLAEKVRKKQQDTR